MCTHVVKAVWAYAWDVSGLTEFVIGALHMVPVTSQTT